MSRILSFALFEAASKKPGLTKAQMNYLDRRVKGKWSLNPDTGLVDIDGSFSTARGPLKILQGVRFGRVTGDFILSGNHLTTLEGAPQKVGGDFYCSHNQLTSLEGAPQKVGGDFDCRDNNLTSLEGAPQEVGGWFNCSYNRLTSLKGAPQEVGWNFDCSNNRLTSLEGAPQKVGGNFNLRGNQLTSLKGSPQDVGGSFDCSYNRLTSLKGAPQKIGGRFSCDAFQTSNWNFSGWLEILVGEGRIENPEQAKRLISPLLEPKLLDAYFQENPLDLDMLEEFPDIKKGVLQRTGLPEVGGAASALKIGLF